MTCSVCGHAVCSYATEVLVLTPMSAAIGRLVGDLSILGQFRECHLGRECV